MGGQGGGVGTQDGGQAGLVVVGAGPQGQDGVRGCPHRGRLPGGGGLAGGPGGEGVDADAQVAGLLVHSDQAVPVELQQRGASLPGRDRFRRAASLLAGGAGAVGGQVGAGGVGGPEGLWVAGGVQDGCQVHRGPGQAGRGLGISGVQCEQEGDGDGPGVPVRGVAVPVRVIGQQLVQLVRASGVQVQVGPAGDPLADHVGGGVGQRQRQLPQGLGQGVGPVVEQVRLPDRGQPLPQVGGGLVRPVHVDVNHMPATAGQDRVTAPRGGQHPPCTGVTGRPPCGGLGGVGDVVQHCQPRAAGGRGPVQERPRIGLGVAWLPGPPRGLHSGSGLGVCGDHAAGNRGVGPDHQVRPVPDRLAGVGGGQLGLTDPAPARQHLGEHHPTPAAISCAAVSAISVVSAGADVPSLRDLVTQPAAGLERRRQGRDLPDQ